jgi:hypothetical protein
VTVSGTKVTIGGNEALDPPTAAGPPTFHDRVRLYLAVGMLAGVAVISILLICSVAFGDMTADAAKELALSIVALFGIVAPIIGFYFAAKERG